MERPILIQARTASGRRKEHGSPSFFENPAIVFVNLCLYSFDPFQIFVFFHIRTPQSIFSGSIPEFRDILCTAHRRAIVVSGWLHGFTLLTQQFSNE